MASQTCPWSWASLPPFQTYVGVADGLPGDRGSMESLPEGTMLRRIVNPAPIVGLNSRSSACRWVVLGALRIELAWPNASETPNPSIRWNVVAPLTVTAAAAPAGT